MIKSDMADHLLMHKGIGANEIQKQTMSALRIRTADSEKKVCEPAPLVLTIGHSTRTLKEFISLLHAHGATCVVDVRTVPRSRHNPQFNKASLPSSLKKAGLGYVHLPGLGGLRRARRDSVNLGWRCHRSLIADALLVRGIRAEEIMSPTRRHIHSFTPFPKVRGATIAYPAKTSQTTPKQPGDNHHVDSSRPLEKKSRKRMS